MRKGLSGRAFTLILLATVAALIFRAMLRVELRAIGIDEPLAAHLSYLAVPVSLLVLLWPLRRRGFEFLSASHAFRPIHFNVIGSAILIGICLRLAWWCQLVAGVSFGIYQSGSADFANLPVFTFSCPTASLFAFAVLITAVVTPFIEEFIHRGCALNYLERFGRWTAVLVSAGLFALMHKQASWGFAFVAGTVFALQYLVTRSLLTSIISHGVVNALIQLDWNCLNTRWNPEQNTLPLFVPGTVAILCLAATTCLIIALLRRMGREGTVASPTLRRLE